MKWSLRLLVFYLSTLLAAPQLLFNTQNPVGPHNTGSRMSLQHTPAMRSDPSFVTPNNTQVYGNRRPQNEPGIAVNPTNSQDVVIGYNDYTGPIGPGISTTTTGGDTPASWTYEGQLQGGGALNPAFAPAGDPALAFDSSGNLYYVTMTTRFTLLGEIFLRRSTDGGLTFPTISVVSSVTGFTSGMDNPAIAIDQSRTPNRIYVAWSDRNIGQAIRFAYTDVGPSWPPANWTLTTATISGYKGVISSSLCCNIGAAIAVGPNGEVYVTYHNNDGVILVSVSKDNGATFPNLGTIVDSSVVYFPGGTECNAAGFAQCVPNTQIRVDDDPSIAVDTSSSSARGTVYIAWADYTNQHGDIWIRKSTDAGNTWSSRAKVNDDTGNADHFFPALAVHPSNGKVFLAFYDRRDDPANRIMNLYFAFTLPASYPTFTNGRLTTAPSDPSVLTGWGFMGDYIGTAVSPGTGSTFDVAWTDLRDGSTTSHDSNSNIYFASFDPDTLPILQFQPIFWLPACWRDVLLIYLCSPLVGYGSFTIYERFWILGPATTVNLTARMLPAGVKANFNPQQGTPPFTSTLTLTNATPTGLTAGDYEGAVDATNSTGAKTSANFTFDATAGAFLLIDHYYANPGDNVTLEGQGFKPNTAITLSLNSTSLPQKPTTNSKGTFSIQIQLPMSATQGDQRIIADDGAGKKANNTLLTPFPSVPADLSPGTPIPTPIFPSGLILLATLSLAPIIASRRVPVIRMKGRS